MDSFARDDVAVVRLRESVSFGPYINNIQLNMDDSYPPDDTLCRAQGWGCTEKGTLLIKGPFMSFSFERRNQTLNLVFTPLSTVCTTLLVDILRLIKPALDPNCMKPFIDHIVRTQCGYNPCVLNY